MAFKIDKTNYFRQRRRRAKLLCESLGEHAEYVKESICVDTSTNYFVDFEDAVEQISSVAKEKSVKFLIHEVIKSKHGWGVTYKTRKLDKPQSLC